MKEIITANPFFGLILSYLAFETGKYLFKKTGSPLCNPLLIGLLITIFTLKIFHIPTEHYFEGGNLILFFLGPATISLAVPLYKQWDLFKKYWIPVMTGSIAGSFVAVLSVILLGKLLNLDDTIIVSFMPKSITAPIGIEVSAMIGGIPSITVLSIVITGVTGNISAPFICKLFRIKHAVAKGIGIGVASHVVGTSKAMEMGEIEGSMSALSLIIAGILTLFWTPVLTCLI